MRAHQRNGSTNIGCGPSAYPTKNYIWTHARVSDACAWGLYIEYMILMRNKLDANLTRGNGLYRIMAHILGSVDRGGGWTKRRGEEEKCHTHPPTRTPHSQRLITRTDSPFQEKSFLYIF